MVQARKTRTQRPSCSSMYYDVVLTFAQSDCSLHELLKSLYSILDIYGAQCVKSYINYV